MNRIALILLTFMLITSCSVKNKLGQNQLEIHDLQGCSHISPYNGQHVSGIQGVVTHKYNNGFSMQSINPDDKPCSSEGIFVLTGQFPEEVPGDLVSVSGVVNEFSAGSEEDYNLSRTEIHNPSIIFISKYQELPSPVILDSPEYIIPNEVIENDGLKIFDPLEDGLDYYESLEFMIVEIQKGLVVGPKNEYTEIVLLPISKLDKNIISINGAVVDRKFDKNPERIMVKLAQGDNQNITLGDMTASKVVGIMDYSFGNYKIFLNSKLSIEPATHETNVFQKDPNSITIASYNVENLSIYDDESKFYTIAKQIVQSLGSPDILLLHEIMDDSGTIDDGTISSNVSLTKLINAIIEKGGPDYEFFDNPPVNNQDGGGLIGELVLKLL
jgi:predicted extracellular nuclease